MKIDLDKKNDVLYIVIEKSQLSYGEDHDGIVFMRDVQSDKLTGITILGFDQKYKSGMLRDITLPSQIRFHEEIYPKLGKL